MPALGDLEDEGGLTGGLTDGEEEAAGDAVMPMPIEQAGMPSLARQIPIGKSKGRKAKVESKR